jgi:hypothetical protein
MDPPRKHLGPGASPGRDEAPPPSSTTVILPSERHRQLLQVLDGMAHVDQRGRRVAWGYQERLARRLGIKPRRLRQLIADLRTPERDPRHLNVAPTGRRLGLLRVEPTRRQVADGSTRYGVDLYVLLFPQGAFAAVPVAGDDGQRALPDELVSAGQAKGHSGGSALHNKRQPVARKRTVGGEGAVITEAKGLLRVLGTIEAKQIIAAAESWGDVPEVEALALACRRP